MGAIDRCVLCGRAYAHHRAVPRWAFRPDGAAAGTAHTSCSTTHADRKRYIYGGLASRAIEVERFGVWLLQIRPRPPAHTPAWWAELLLLESGPAADDEPGPGELRLLSWWREGPTGMTESEAGETLRTRRRTLRAWRAWRADLDEPARGAG